MFHKQSAEILKDMFDKAQSLISMSKFVLNLKNTVLYMTTLQGSTVHFYYRQQIIRNKKNLELLQHNNGNILLKS